MFLTKWLPVLLHTVWSPHGPWRHPSSQGQSQSPSWAFPAHRPVGELTVSKCKRKQILATVTASRRHLCGSCTMNPVPACPHCVIKLLLTDSFGKDTQAIKIISLCSCRGKPVSGPKSFVEKGNTDNMFTISQHYVFAYLLFHPCDHDLGTR